MERRKFLSDIHSGEYLDYVYSEPSENGKFPLVLYIHGAGSRGNDLALLEENSGLLIAQKTVGDKCVVAAPQCHANYWFDLFEVLAEFIDKMRHSDKVDIKRVYIIGSSMGGYTTWQMTISHPDWFAAAVPICGGGMCWAAPRLKDLPIWAFHGALDGTVLPEETIHMVRSVNAHGGKAKITIFENVTHNSWEPALSLDETWEWLLSQVREDADQ